MRTTFEIQTAPSMEDFTTKVALRVRIYNSNSGVAAEHVVVYRDNDPKGLVDSLVNLAAAIEKDIK